MKKSVLITSAALFLSIFFISCTTTKKSYPVLEDNNFVVTEIALSSSFLQENDAQIPEVVKQLPFSTISQFVNMNTGYNLDFSLITDDSIESYTLEKNIKTEKKFAKKVLNYFVEDKNSYVVSVDYHLDPVVIENFEEDSYSEEIEIIEEIAENITEELSDMAENNEIAEDTEDTEESEEDFDISDDEAQEEEVTVNYFYPSRNVARISFVQDYETGKLAVIVTLKTLTFDNKTVFRCKLATEINDWSFNETFTNPETSALVYFDKDIIPLTINNESFTVYKRHNSAPTDGYFYVPTNQEMTFVCTIIDDGNALYDAENLENVRFSYTFNPNAKYRITFKVHRLLISSDRTVSFQIDEKNLLTESINNSEADLSFDENTTDENTREENSEEFSEIAEENSSESDESVSEIKFEEQNIEISAQNSTETEETAE